jgi:hypothetical protein
LAHTPEYPDALGLPSGKAMTLLPLSWLIHIHIGWDVKYGALYWSWGYCTSCQDYGPARVQDFTETLYLNGIIPLSKGKKGKVAHCDFCRRRIEQVWNWEGIAWTDWSHHDGLAALGQRCGIPATLMPADLSAEARLHSLLSSVAQNASLTRMSLSFRGVLGGVILALLVAIPLAMFLYENKVVQPQLDEAGFTMTVAVVSMLPGAILGALTECVLRKSRGVRAQLAEAYRNYPFDLFRLEELSHQYSKAVQKAVQALCDEAPSHR